MTTTEARATIAAALAVLFLVTPGTASATFPGENGRIAFSGEIGIAPERVFTIAPDGSGLEQIGPTWASSPSWSADGRRLAFVRTKTQRRPVMTMTSTGTRVTTLAHGSRTRPEPSFAPSGNRVVYSMGEALWTVRADGTRERKLVKADNCCLLFPQYTPDGTRVSFVGAPEIGVRRGLWEMHRNGTRLQLVRAGIRRGSPASYSPDGRRIAFIRDRKVWVARADGSGAHPIGPGRSRPVWSPEGNRIAVIDDPCGSIFTMRPSGEGRRQLTDQCGYAGQGLAAVTAYELSWQPLPNG